MHVCLPPWRYADRRSCIYDDVYTPTCRYADRRSCFGLPSVDSDEEQEGPDLEERGLPGFPDKHR
jgi:hypothetical protein